jgi:hypothetical protein
VSERIDLWFGRCNSKLVHDMEREVINSGEFVLLGKEKPELFQGQSDYPSAITTNVYQLVLNGRPRITKLIFTYDTRRDTATCSCSLESTKELVREFALNNIKFSLGKHHTDDHARVML